MSLILAVIQHGTDAAASPSVFNLAINVSFWTVIIFLLLLFVLAKFAFPPILGYAAAREKRIQDALDAARQEREDAQRLIEEQRQALLHARDEAQRVIAEAQKAADRVRREMLDKARAEQEELVQRAKSEIDAERARAVDSLRREAVDLAIAAASKLVERRLDSQEDRRLVTDFLTNVDRGEVAATR
ncbi:MAG TPA: F0F1 ATP synthase subunit B [Longimicrobiales bacterium]